MIVVHGQERNTDDYFSYLTSTLATNGLAENTVLIAPWFKAPADAATNELYWANSDWREGQPSNNQLRLSSFAVIDSLVKQLSNKACFPALPKFIVTGHSSGGLSTHLYGESNSAEALHPALSFRYVVTNSQYFYYPNEYRYNEQTTELYQPSGCIDFNYWPLGYQSPPSYLYGVTAEAYNQQFVSMNIIYLLGNETSPDGSLNTSDCSAVLLGSSRYQRGENVYRFMNEFYAGQHAHTKVLVNGIGHNGEGMYKSPEFQLLIKQLVVD